MRYFTLFISCAWMIFCASFSYADSPKLLLSQNEILPFEPFSVSVEFCPQTVAPQKDESSFGVSVWWRRAGEVGSSVLPYDRFNQPIFALNERDRKCLYLHIQTRVGNSRLIKQDSFTEPGTYEFKARVLLPDGTIVESESQKLVVREPTGVDREALQYLLKNQKVFRFFSSSEILGHFIDKKNLQLFGVGNDVVNSDYVSDILGVLVQRFPTSKYSQWGLLTIALIDEMRIIVDVLTGRQITSRDIANYESPKEKLRSIAERAINPVSANAWFEVGRILALQKKHTEATASFNKAIEKDSTLQSHLISLNELLAYVTYEQSVVGKPLQAPDVLERKLADLKKQGYDVENLSRLPKKLYEEYVKSKSALILMRNKREISVDEYYEKLSALLEDVVVRGMEPKK